MGGTMRVIDMAKLLCGLDGTTATANTLAKTDLTEMARSMSSIIFISVDNAAFITGMLIVNVDRVDAVCAAWVLRGRAATKMSYMTKEAARQIHALDETATSKIARRRAYRSGIERRVLRTSYFE